MKTRKVWKQPVTAFMWFPANSSLFVEYWFVNSQEEEKTLIKDKLLQYYCLTGLLIIQYIAK